MLFTLIGKHPKRPGGQQALEPQTEQYLKHLLDLMTEWKMPLSSLEIRFLVKDYVDRNEETKVRILKISKFL